MRDQPLENDNFVPRFSLLGDARGTLVVLVGVWMIFLPVAILSLAAIVSSWSEKTDWFTSLLSSITPLFALVIGTAIVSRTTMRYLHRRNNKLEDSEP